MKPKRTPIPGTAYGHKWNPFRKHRTATKANIGYKKSKTFGFSSVQKKFRAPGN